MVLAGALPLNAFGGTPCRDRRRKNH